MIIYEKTISGFIEQCNPKNNDLLIAEIKANMKHKIGRGVSTSEERSWRTTLIGIFKNLQHLENKDKQWILLEFKMPFSQKRIDVILVGANGEKKNLLIIELKGWSESYSTETPGILRINSKYVYVGHPSEEANDYKYMLTEQFSEVSKAFSKIEAIALLPNYNVLNEDPIMAAEFDSVLKLANLYSNTNISDFEKYIQGLFNSPIEYADVNNLNKLEYKPTLEFQSHLKEQFKNIKLHGSQMTAYRSLVHEINNYFKTGKKTLITVSGMPGSGKTVIAFKLLGYIYSQMNRTAKLQLPGPEFREAVKQQFDKNTFNAMIGGAYPKSEQEVIIIDEAHKAKGQGTAKQFYKTLFKEQNLVVTLIDDNQVVNKSGATLSQVTLYASNEKFKVINLELKEQFRNAGDATYIDWLRNWIFNEKTNLQSLYPSTLFRFTVLNEADFNARYIDYYEKHNSRMVSFWTQPWDANIGEDELPTRSVVVGKSKYTWNPNWKWEEEFYKGNPGERLPKGLKAKVISTNFNKDKKGSQYIGYFNTSQGSEFDYIFVHLPKLFFLNDDNELDVDLSKLDMYDMKSQIWVKNKQPNPDRVVENKKYFLNRLLVNITRGTKGAFIYCEDEKLQKWIRDKVMTN